MMTVANRSAASVVAVFLLLAGVARAQPSDLAPPAADAPPAAEAVPSSGSDSATAEDQSAAANAPSATSAPEAGVEWDAYHHAFELMAAGARAQAINVLRELVATSPDHPAALRARELLRSAGPGGGLEAPRQQGVTWPAPRTPALRTVVDPEVPPIAAPPTIEDAVGTRHSPTKLARAELIGMQTLMGFGLGVEACVLVNCRSARAWTFGPVAGAGLSLGLAVYGTRHGIRPATAVAVNMGSMWGAFHGYALAATLGDLYSDRYYYDSPGLSVEDEITLGMFLGQLGGAGAGYLFDRWLQPSAGDVSLAGSGALWSSVLTIYLGLTFRPNSFGRHVRYLHWGLMAAVDGGMVLGGLLARISPMSRGRVMLLDLGAGLGLGLGTGLAFLLAGDSVSVSAAFGTGALGMIGGAALSYFITRSWDVPDLPVNVGLAPVEGGATATVGGRF